MENNPEIYFFTDNEPVICDDDLYDDYDEIPDITIPNIKIPIPPPTPPPKSKILS
jgi:hypothetical protein